MKQTNSAGAAGLQLAVAKNIQGRKTLSLPFESKDKDLRYSLNLSFSIALQNAIAMQNVFFKALIVQ